MVMAGACGSGLNRSYPPWFTIVVREGLSASGLAAIGVAVILIGVNPLAGHAVARAIAIRRGATWSDPQDESTGSPGEEQ